MQKSRIKIEDIYRAKRKIRKLIYRTPLLSVGRANPQLADSIYLKLENYQLTGSFKLRGAANEILNLTPFQKQLGVIAVSSGNHGKAVAYVSSTMDINSIICVSNKVPRNKVASIKKFGASTIIAGSTFDEANDYAHDLQSTIGLTFLEPFDDPLLIAGQGTIGLEIVEDLPDVSTVIVPVAGGGLISGIAIALKSLNPKVNIIGVSMEKGPVMYHSIKAGKIISMEEEESLADALIGGIGNVNNYTFDICKALVDEIVLVSEEEIGKAMAYLLHEYHLVVEGGAAVGVAALLANKIRSKGDKTVIVLTGRNVEIEQLFTLYKQYTS